MGANALVARVRDLAMILILCVTRVMLKSHFSFFLVIGNFFPVDLIGRTWALNQADQDLNPMFSTD